MAKVCPTDDGRHRSLVTGNSARNLAGKSVLEVFRYQYFANYPDYANNTAYQFAEGSHLMYRIATTVRTS